MLVDILFILCLCIIIYLTYKLYEILYAVSAAIDELNTEYYNKVRDSYSIDDDR